MLKLHSVEGVVATNRNAQVCLYCYSRRERGKKCEHEVLKIKKTPLLIQDSGVSLETRQKCTPLPAFYSSLVSAGGSRPACHVTCGSQWPTEF